MEKLVYTVEELRELLGIDRPAAYDLARKIGVRIGPKRLMVPRRALEEFLASGRGSASTG